MTGDVSPPPFGALIEQRRVEMRPKMSARKAAGMAGLSEGRWRQIVKGYQATGGGKVPVNGPAETVARMAQVVGVTAEELSACGREDAAEEMRKAQQAHPDELRWQNADLEIGAVFAELRAWLESSDEEWPESPPTAALAFWSTDQLLEVVVARHQSDMERVRQANRLIIERGQRIRLLESQLAAMNESARFDRASAREEEGELSGAGPNLAAVAEHGDIDPDSGEFNT